MRTRSLWMGFLPAVLLLAGAGMACGTPPGAGAEGARTPNASELVDLPEGEAPPQPPSRYLGKFVYKTHCGACHGSIGPDEMAVPGYIPPVPNPAPDADIEGMELGEKTTPLPSKAEAEEIAEEAGLEKPKVANPFYPKPVGDYKDLYRFLYFPNGTEFGGFIDRNQAPLADRTYREIFEILAEPHGTPGKERDLTEVLSDRERWAVVYYIANQGLDNGKEDWIAAWDQQLALRKNIYGTHCSICHGAVGRGDGPEGHSFEPKPMNFHQRDWAVGVKPGYPVTDQYLYDIIANGKIKPGSNTEWTGMPWWKDQLRDQDIWALVDYIRSLSTDE